MNFEKSSNRLKKINIILSPHLLRMKFNGRFGKWSALLFYPSFVIGWLLLIIFVSFPFVAYAFCLENLLLSFLDQSSIFIPISRFIAIILVCLYVYVFQYVVYASGFNEGYEKGSKDNHYINQ